MVCKVERERVVILWSDGKRRVVLDAALVFEVEPVVTRIARGSRPRTSSAPRAPARERRAGFDASVRAAIGQVGCSPMAVARHLGCGRGKVRGAFERLGLEPDRQTQRAVKASNSAMVTGREPFQYEPASQATL
jgi:hypothetical protein